MRERRSSREADMDGSSSWWGLVLILVAVAALYYFQPRADLLGSWELPPQVTSTLAWLRESFVGFSGQSRGEIPVVGSTVAVLQAAEVNYVQAGYGNFIFSNNPEQIRAEDLADKDRGNVLLYQAEVSGPTQIYAEHVNMVLLDGVLQQVYFGVQLYNPNDEAVNLTVERMGSSHGDWSGSSLWRQFLQYRPLQITLAPKEMRWFFTEQSILYGQVFDAALALDIPLEQKIEVNLAVFTQLPKMNGYAKPRGMVLRQEADGQMSSRVYSGIGKYPLLSCHLQWTLDDSVAAERFLPLSYGGETRTSWVTHDNKSAEAVRQDILAMRLRYDGQEQVADVLGQDENGQAFNLANWGVQYAHTFRLENKSKSPRTVRYVVQPSHSATPKQTLLGWAEGGALQVLQADEQRPAGDDKLVLWEVQLQPGEYAEKTVFLILAAQSYGGVRHSLQVVE